MISASSGGLPVRSPKPNTEPVAAGTQAGIDHGADHPRVVFGRLAARAIHLQVDVVVRGRYQDAGFLDAGCLDGLEVVQRRAHPGRYLRARPSLTGGNRLEVDGGVGEELRLADHRATQLVQQVVEIDDLLDGVGRSRLLTIAKRGVRNPDVRGEGLRDRIGFEADRWDPAIGKIMAQQIRLRAILHSSLYAYVDLYCNLLTATTSSRTLGWT